MHTIRANMDGLGETLSCVLICSLEEVEAVNMDGISDENGQVLVLQDGTLALCSCVVHGQGTAPVPLLYFVALEVCL